MCMQRLPAVCGDSTAPPLGLLPFLTPLQPRQSLRRAVPHIGAGRHAGSVVLLDTAIPGAACGLTVRPALTPPPFFLEATLGQPATTHRRSAVCNQHGAHAPVGHAGLARGLHCWCGCEDAGLPWWGHMHLSCLGNGLAFVSPAHGSMGAKTDKCDHPPRCAVGCTSLLIGLLNWLFAVDPRYKLEEPQYRPVLGPLVGRPGWPGNPGLLVACFWCNHARDGATTLVAVLLVCPTNRTGRHCCPSPWLPTRPARRTPLGAGRSQMCSRLQHPPACWLISGRCGGWTAR